MVPLRTLIDISGCLSRQGWKELSHGAEPRLRFGDAVAVGSPLESSLATRGVDSSRQFWGVDERIAVGKVRCPDSERCGQCVGYLITDPPRSVEEASEHVIRHAVPEVNSLGRTLIRWKTQIVAWHHARVSNGPTEAINNLIKRIKRIGFGFRRFRNYRIRASSKLGKPNWELLATITPR